MVNCKVHVVFNNFYSQKLNPLSSKLVFGDLLHYLRWFSRIKNFPLSDLFIVHTGPSWENPDEAYIRKRVTKSKINAELLTNHSKKKEEKIEKENKKVIAFYR